MFKTILESIENKLENEEGCFRIDWGKSIILDNVVTELCLTFIASENYKYQDKELKIRNTFIKKTFKEYSFKMASEFDTIEGLEDGDALYEVMLKLS